MVSRLENGADTMIAPEKKPLFLLIASIFSFCFLVIKIQPVSVDANIRITIQEQQGNILSISDARRPLRTFTYKIDSIDFPQSETLTHKKLGPLAVRKNFFMEAVTEVTVAKEGLYEFEIWSDDGFRLSLNGFLIAEHKNDRAYRPTTAEFFMPRGKHQLKLEYFQGVAKLGLVASYRYLESKRKHKIGEHSEYLLFSIPERK